MKFSIGADKGRELTRHCPWGESVCTTRLVHYYLILCEPTRPTDFSHSPLSLLFVYKVPVMFDQSIE